MKCLQEYRKETNEYLYRVWVTPAHLHVTARCQAGTSSKYTLPTRDITCYDTGGAISHRALAKTPCHLPFSGVHAYKAVLSPESTRIDAFLCPRPLRHFSAPLGR